MYSLSYEILSEKKLLFLICLWVVCVRVENWVCMDRCLSLTNNEAVEKSITSLCKLFRVGLCSSWDILGFKCEYKFLET